MQDDVAAVLPLYSRPQNIQEICQEILQVQGLVRLIISKNDPSLDISRYLSLSDPRIIVVHQPAKKSAAVRTFISAQLPELLQFSVDDDLFLTTAQIELLLQHLRRDSSRLHGFFGQTFSYSDSVLDVTCGLCRAEQPVDVLNRAYFYTKSHAQRAVALMSHYLGDDQDGPFDDIFLSRAGAERPLIHAIGGWRDCPSSNEKGVALWLEEGFMARRAEVALRLITGSRNPPPAEVRIHHTPWQDRP